MNIPLNTLITALLTDPQLDTEEVRTLAAAAFPLGPEEEGWFSGECEHVVYAVAGSSDSATLMMSHVLPEWLVQNLGQSYDKLWSASIYRPVEGDEHGNVTREMLNAYASAQPTLGRALMISVLLGIKAQERETDQ